MIYFIGYLAPHEVAVWYENITKDISEIFDINKIYEYIPAHITIIPPFETSDVTVIEKYIEQWINNNATKESFKISDFGHFDDRVVYADVIAGAKMRESVSDFCLHFKETGIIPISTYPLWHPHITLANHTTPDKIERIKEYVAAREKPDFVVPFNNITIFQRTDDAKWVVHKLFDL
jgi:2'-5' RNA ligase